MRPDPGSDPLAASDHWGGKRLAADYFKWCFCNRLTRCGIIFREINNISKTSIFQRQVMRELWRPLRPGHVALARSTRRPVPSGGGFFRIPCRMHDCQNTKETEGEQSAGQRPCQMGKRRRCAWASIGTEPRQARAPLRGRAAYPAMPWGGGTLAVE